MLGFPFDWCVGAGALVFTLIDVRGMGGLGCWVSHRLVPKAVAWHVPVLCRAKANRCFYHFLRYD